MKILKTGDWGLFTGDKGDKADLADLADLGAGGQKDKERLGEKYFFFLTPDPPIPRSPDPMPNPQ
ncbi:hypothetical protein [Tolypothrix sp. VBCCA 56010]|uniref:hypothetical protein n=1 Tax=Tolypothrix sp. VBCCA 56010 TaxID=3137731 RepID=UPI003D7CFFF6